MKTSIKNILCILFLVALVAIATVPIIRAAPRMTKTGAIPLYDSGWVLAAGGGWQTFSHNLGAFPTNVAIFAADNAFGDYPTLVLPSRKAYTAGDVWGGNVYDVYCSSLRTYWQPDGIAYHQGQNKWYQRGTDYVRVLVFSADDAFGGPPCRP